MNRFRIGSLGALCLGVVLGIALSFALGDPRGLFSAQAKDAPPRPPDVAALAAELETVKGKLPDQSHAMSDVGYHFTNLWFAARKENWPLADFYFKETKSHLAWAVRIIPKRKDSAGKEIDLGAILQALENSPLKQVGEAIAAKDRKGFEKAYRFTLEGCYACHKASDKPYIHPQVPTAPEVQVVNFDPKADWPK